MADEFRMRPAGWVAPVDLGELIETCVDDVYLNVDECTTRSEVAKEVRATVAAAREYERARIVARLRNVSSNGTKVDPAVSARMFTDMIEKEGI